MAADWYYRSGNREVGPLSLHDLSLIARQGRLGADAEVRHGQSGVWVAADRVPGLFQGSSRSTPPPLPSSTESLFEAIATAGPVSGRRKTGGADGASFNIRLLCGGGIAAAAVLLAVVVVAVKLGGASQGPKAGPSETVVVQTSPGTNEPLGENLHSATASQRMASRSAGNWMERIEENSHDSVVVVVNPEDHSQGTGFVIATDGDHKLLLTNKHVLRIGENPETDPLARNCYIKLVSGTMIPAKLAGEAREPAVDLAVITVDSRDLRPLGTIKEFADIHVGENVVSVGNPGIPGTGVILEGTVTPGIVSGKREDLLIQTTAPINHGNSGGPLVNETGQVLGVNTMSAKDMQATNFAFRADWVLDKRRWEFYQDISRLMSAIPRP